MFLCYCYIILCVVCQGGSLYFSENKSIKRHIVIDFMPKHGYSVIKSITRRQNMLITDKTTLKEYHLSNSLWMGIPSIEVTKKGRTFLTFYSGGITEDIGNYVLLVYSEDGKNFSDPVAVCFEENARCFDPCLWIDPTGRLWFTWAKHPDDGTYGAICDDPNADELVFGKEFFIGHNVMMNKPVVLSSGEWLFPIAVWEKTRVIRNLVPKYNTDVIPDVGAFAYITSDMGKTFVRSNAADVKKRSFDEHMFLELNDGTVRCFVRCFYGIGACDSFDGGLHWGKDFDTGYGGPCSRFHIRRLKSGRILLINHFNFTGRNNLYAMLSEDDGKTFPHKLLLDERNAVSYPDATVDANGMIHITYDRERGYPCKSLAENATCAKEILTACISEEDIINGTLVNKNSYIKNVAVKLYEYNGSRKNPYNEEKLFDSLEYSEHLSKGGKAPEDILSQVFDTYRINCSNIHNIEAKKLDELASQYKKEPSLDTLNSIIAFVRKAETTEGCDEKAVVREMRNYIITNLEKNISTDELAEKLHFSKSYLRHIFKNETGTSVTGFRRAGQIKKAKLLLKTSDSKITDVAAVCGFENPGYFAEIFLKETGVSPTDYRKMWR